MSLFSTIENVQRVRVGDGQTTSVLANCAMDRPLLFLVWPQLGDFDSLEYAWWLNRDGAQLESYNLQVRAVGIGDRKSGQAFCQFTGFPESSLYLDPEGGLHEQLDLYPGLKLKVPGFSSQQNAWFNLLLMCAGIGSSGTLAEVFRGYWGDRRAPQLIGADEIVKASPLPKIQGKFFDRAGGSGFQRPFELATLRLRNMVEVLGNWKTYVPDAAHITQRGGTFVFDAQQQLVYEFRDSGILGFSETMYRPLDFLEAVLDPLPQHSELHAN